MSFERNKKVFIEIDGTEMSEAQIRLLKSINTMLQNVLTTESESEFFDGSAETMRMCASLIKQAHFATDLQVGGIPYAEQALEYSMDILHEHMNNSKVIQYDN